MNTYEVEIVHELSGNSMTFIYESDSDQDDVWSEIMQDMSITVSKQ